MAQRSLPSLLLGVSLVAFAAPTVARAGILFTNFGPGLTYDVTSGNPVGNAFDSNDYAEANSFIAAFTGSFDSLQISLSCAFSCADPFGVLLTADNTDQPGTVLESFSVPGGTLGPIGIYNAPLFFTSALHPQFNAGARYWVAVTSGMTNTIGWNLNTTGDVSDQAISTDNAATWFSQSGNTPGGLEVDAVPEPATISLLPAALILGFFLQKRRSNSTLSVSR